MNCEEPFIVRKSKLSKAERLRRSEEVWRQKREEEERLNSGSRWQEEWDAMMEKGYG